MEYSNKFFFFTVHNQINSQVYFEKNYIYYKCNTKRYKNPLQAISKKMTYKPTFGKTYLCGLYLDAPFVNVLAKPDRGHSSNLFLPPTPLPIK